MMFEIVQGIVCVILGIFPENARIFIGFDPIRLQKFSLFF
jgi:hypothetical protein